MSCHCHLTPNSLILGVRFGGDVVRGVGSGTKGAVKAIDGKVDDALDIRLSPLDGTESAVKVPTQSTLHTRGVKPLPGTRIKPEGIPNNWRIKNTRGKGGIEYYNPKNKNEHIRVMQGDPNKPYQNSQKPYVRQRDKSGSYLDQDGNRVGKKDPSGHIPLNDFKVNQGAISE